MNLFIPAPANSLLATYHWSDGPNLRPLLVATPKAVGR